MTGYVKEHWAREPLKAGKHIALLFIDSENTKTILQKHQFFEYCKNRKVAELF